MLALFLDTQVADTVGQRRHWREIPEQLHGLFSACLDDRAGHYGEVTLTEGVDELIRGEQEFDSMYNSSAET